MYDDEDDFNGVFRVRVKHKINQDRGCVAYPYNGSTQQALFMVLDGHGAEGDLVSEFVMRQIVVSLEKVCTVCMLRLIGHEFDIRIGTIILLTLLTGLFRSPTSLLSTNQMVYYSIVWYGMVL